MRRCLLFGALGAALTAVGAQGEPYWYAYEAEGGFPEEEGWTRYFSDPPGGRWLEEGSLFIDSRASPEVNEQYGLRPAGGYDPDPGETFVMQWRLRVHESQLWSAGVHFTSDQQRAIILLFDEHRLMSFYEPAVYLDLTPAVFHDFELRTADMMTYELAVDGVPTLKGEFFQSLFPAGVGFGDMSSGRGLMEWDYFGFGVVPEPASAAMAIALTCCLSGHRNRFVPAAGVCGASALHSERRRA